MINKVWVVIPTYNRADDLIACLNSLSIANAVKEQIIVVDNYSNDDTLDKLKRYHPEVHLIPLTENLGASKASNIGFKFALENNAEFVLRLDSDTIVDQDFFIPLLTRAEQNPKVGVLSPKIYYYDPPEEIWFAGANQHPWHFGTIDGHRHEKDAPVNSQVRKVDYIWAAAMLIKREVLEKTGGFDTDFFVYYEEVDFCLRVKKLGYQLLFVPDSYVWHKVGSSANNAWTAYNWNRSKMLLYRKHAKSKLHFAGLFCYAFFYSCFSFFFFKGIGNRGPIKDTFKGLHNGFTTDLRENK